jgi:hypothetical protein
MMSLHMNPREALSPVGILRIILSILMISGSGFSGSLQRGQKRKGQQIHIKLVMHK